MINRIVCLALTAIIAVSCFSGCAKVGAFDVNKKIVCEVDGEPVTYDEYKYFFYAHHMDLFGTVERELTDEDFQRVKAMTEDSLRRKATIMALLDEYDVKLDSDAKDYVDEAVEAQIELYEGEDGYRDFLLDGRITGNVFRELIMLTFKYDPALREIFKMGVNKDLPVTDEAMLASVLGGDFYMYQYAFFELTEGKNSMDLEKAAKDFCKGLEDGTKTFTKLECDAKGQRPVGFEEAVLKLDEGETSEVLWGADWGQNAGYYVFRRLAVDEATVKANIEKFELEDEYFAASYLRYIREQSKDVKIEYAKYFESLDYATLLKREEIEA